MADQQHHALLQQEAARWNEWRRQHPEIHPDLSEADLSEADLSGADLRDANLMRANLSWAYLSEAALNKANLRESTLPRDAQRVRSKRAVKRACGVPIDVYR